VHRVHRKIIADGTGPGDRILPLSEILLFEDGYSMRDMRSAFATACVRVSASSFAIAFSMWVRTVSGEIES